MPFMNALADVKHPLGVLAGNSYVGNSDLIRRPWIYFAEIFK